MDFFQIKAIRKNEKPPIWRRAYVPSNITFAQMAVILDLILEIDPDTDYEFEFFHKKDRIVEWDENSSSRGDFFYSCLDSAETYVNFWMLTEKWFSFRQTGRDLPEYRVEIEKHLKLKPKEGFEHLPSSPAILKETSPKQDPYWSDPQAVNTLLVKNCFIKEGEPSYAGLLEIQKEINSQHGIIYAKKPISLENHIRRSPDSYLKEIAERLRNSEGEDLEKLRDEISSILLPDALAEVADTRQTESSRTESSQTESSRMPTLENFLYALPKETLLEIAENREYQITGKKKKKIAFELARQMLTPQNMRDLLLCATEENLDAFEEAMKKGCFLPTKEEERRLSRMKHLTYIVSYTDGKKEVPRDVITAYEIIRKTGYRDYHKKMSWLLQCCYYFSFMTAVAPAKILYRMYQRRKDLAGDYEEFLSTFHQLPEKYVSVRIIGDKCIGAEILKQNTVRQIESSQRGKDYYIPSEREILSFYNDDYPSSEKPYQDFYQYLTEEMNLSDEFATDACVYAFDVFSDGGMPSVFMEFINEEGIVFEDEEAAGKFFTLLMDVQSITRSWQLKGHNPEEMSQIDFEYLKQPVSFAPLTNEAAKLRETEINPLLAMGLQTDSNPAVNKVSEAEKTKKIYPNDPCPCGSGKKYKKCCGRNR